MNYANTLSPNGPNTYWYSNGSQRIDLIDQYQSMDVQILLKSILSRQTLNSTGYFIHIRDFRTAKKKTRVARRVFLAFCYGILKRQTVWYLFYKINSMRDWIRLHFPWQGTKCRSRFSPSGLRRFAPGEEITIAKPAICLQVRPRDFVVRNLELRARSPHMVIGYTQR